MRKSTLWSKNTQNGDIDADQADDCPHLARSHAA
jgi:hypothetical protein